MKNFFILSLFVPLFSICSCQTAKDEYEGRIDKESPEAVVDIESRAFPTTYENGQSIDVSKIVFTFRGSEIPPLLEGEKITDDTFFVTRSKDTPTLSFVKPANYKVQSNAESANMTFYVAIRRDEHIYVSSKAITITVTNAGALKPWVWFVVSGVVIFAIVAMVVFTKRYKEKHS